MEEEKYMRRCIQLAKNGLCGAPPNPMVGAVIVADGRIIGEGFHARCGEGHAEVNAIRSVRSPELLKRATIYVSLEPCAHYGKTPPCADLIIEKRIPRIVIGCQDPFSKVAGRGIEKLRQAGREVVVGVLEEECRQLIRRFLTFHIRKRPYITLKWAESADGFIDRERTDGQATQFSSPLTQMLTHKRRAEHQAILVGTRTALLDNPSLNVRHWYGRSPVRVVIDRELSLPQDFHLFDGSQPTLVFSRTDGDAPQGVTVCPVGDAADMIPSILETLHRQGLQALLVEGGARLLQSFIDAGLWDEAFVEESPLRLGAGVESPVMPHGQVYERQRFFGRDYRHYQNKQITD